MNSDKLLDLIYPVGSIYMNVSDVNPQSFIGGTWKRIQGRFLLSTGSGYNAGSTGGEAKHTLTVDEMPRHNHPCGVSTMYKSEEFQAIMPVVEYTYYNRSAPGTAYAGGSMAHNNMPPYLVVYMWQRTA